MVYHSLANVHVGIGPGGVVVLQKGRTLYNIYIIYVMCFGCLAQSLCLESKFWLIFIILCFCYNLSFDDFV